MIIIVFQYSTFIFLSPHDMFYPDASISHHNTPCLVLYSCLLIFPQVEIPFACLHKTPLLEGWFRLLPLGNNEVDVR